MIAYHIIKSIRDGNHVRRWHTRRVHHQETVGEHTANVMAIVFALCHTKPPSSHLMSAVLMHDTAEQWTGDVPATAKWDSPELRGALEELEDRKMLENFLVFPDLTEKERLVLKWADMLDLCYYCLDELRLGNANMAEVFDKGVAYLHQLSPLAVGLQLLDSLEKERNRV
jgi:5'-deoxynucleotidase YfbR-like HD superfamily hydrolase